MASSRSRTIWLATVAFGIILAPLVVYWTAPRPDPEEDPEEINRALADPGGVTKCNARIVSRDKITIMTWTAGCEFGPGERISGVVRIEGHDLDPTSFVIRASAIPHSTNRAVKEQPIPPGFRLVNRTTAGLETPVVTWFDRLPRGAYNLRLSIHLGEKGMFEIEAGYVEVLGRREKPRNEALLEDARWPKVAIPTASH
jgi:hypothetical protein